jgi:hypothetical protein
VIRPRLHALDDAREGQRRDQHRLDRVVGELVPLDRDPGERLVAREPAPEIDSRVVEIAGPDLGEVEDRVAEMGELPVDDGGDPVAREEKLAGTRVALDERQALRRRGQVPAQPADGELDEGDRPA